MLLINSTVSEIDHNITCKLHVHRAVAWYIRGFDPKEGWKFRGIDGYSQVDFQQFKQKKTEEAIQAINNDQELQDQFNDFITECLEAFKAWNNDSDYLLENYFPDKQFYFVLGTGRTGGTYMMRELSRAVEWPYEDSLILFTHDTMPAVKFTSGELREDLEVREMYGLGWRRPHSFHNLVFQIIQYLVYIDREFSHLDKIVKKSQFGRCLKLVDEIFGNNAEYIVTVRHPGACASSWKQGGFSKESEENLDYHREKILYGWESSYRNIVRDDLPDGRIKTVLYGPEMENFLKQFFKKHGSEKNPEKCRVKDRNYDDFWRSDSVKKVIDRVKTDWEIHGLDFPEPKEIL